jgi:hypothetical protein
MACAAINPDRGTLNRTPQIANTMAAIIGPSRRAAGTAARFNAQASGTESARRTIQELSVAGSRTLSGRHQEWNRTRRPGGVATSLRNPLRAHQADYTWRRSSTAVFLSVRSDQRHPARPSGVAGSRSDAMGLFPGEHLACLAQTLGRMTNERAPKLDVRLDGAHQSQEFSLGVIAPPSAAAVEFEEVVATALSHCQPPASYFFAVPAGKIVCHDAPDVARPAAPASQCRGDLPKSSLVVSII